MKDSRAVVVKDLHKVFRLPHEQHSGVKQYIINALKHKKLSGYENHQVLKGVSFEIKKGEFFGIVGRNGSGKSTLLKLIAGIYEPERGTVEINGSLVPFIELGVGFNPELTGRENVFLNGALLGFSHKQVEDIYDEIVEFAELERFMDQKLKNYSSGMQVRLAFSIAIRADADILVLDEVLAVGDEAFQRKCYQYFAELKKNKKTVVLVTHSMENVSIFCDRAIMIEDGKIIKSGNVKEVADSYTRLNADSSVASRSGKQNPPRRNRYADAKLILTNRDGKVQDTYYDNDADKTLNINLTIDIKKNIDKDTFCSILIKNINGEVVSRIASEDVNKGTTSIGHPRIGEKIYMSSEIQNIFGEGEYTVAVSLKSIDRTEVYIETEDKAKFIVAGLGLNGFSLRPHHTTTVSKA